MELGHGVLGRTMIGAYLYGSSLLGGLGPRSDLDILIITCAPTSFGQKQELARRLLTISQPPDPPGLRRPVELTVVVQADVKPWQYPPRFDFQYGDWLRRDFEAGNVAPWGSTTKPDLASLITQVLLASRTLHGPNPHDVLDPVPRSDYLAATVGDIDNLLDDLEHDTGNVLLTLARIWTTIETNGIWSKDSAANWVITRSPREYHPVMIRARDIYVGHIPNMLWADLETRVTACARYLVESIRRAVKNDAYPTNRPLSLGV
jgi:predicted nucleotidyltransferase